MNEWMNEQTNERSNKWMNELMNERMKEQMNEWIKYQSSTPMAEKYTNIFKTLFLPQEFVVGVVVLEGAIWAVSFDPLLENENS